MAKIRLERLPYNNGQDEYELYNGSPYAFGYLYYSQTEGNSRLKLELGENNYRTVVKENGEIKYSESEADYSSNRNFEEVFREKKKHLREIAEQLNPQGARELLIWMIENERANINSLI